MEWTRGNILETKDAFFFLTVFVFIYSHLFQLPFTPIYFEGDQMIPVSNGIRMLGGEIIYKDFFHFIPPGADLVYENLFRIFGVKIWVVNLTILLLTIAQVALVWFLSKKVLTGATVFLPAVLFLAVGFRPFGIDGSYRLFSIVFVLAAVAVLFERRSLQNLFFAGCLCGIASFFVQPRGVLALVGISVFLIWENYRDGFDFRRLVKYGTTLVVSFFAIVIVTQFYFLWQAGIDNYYFSMVGFIRDHYRHDPFNNTTAYFSDLPHIADFIGPSAQFSLFSGYARLTFISIFYYLLIPFIYIAFLIVWWWKKRDASENNNLARLVLLCSVGAFLAAGISAPTAFRIAHVAIPGLIIFVWLWQQSVKLRRLLPTALILFSLLGVAYTVQRQVTPKYFLEMPAGRAVFLYEPAFEKYKWIGENTSPGEFFYEPHHPNFYFPFHLKNPTPLYMARDSEYTPAFQVDAVIRSLEKSRPRLIIWPTNWTKPAQSRAPGDHIEPLWQFVKANYELKYIFPKHDLPVNAVYGDNEVWEIK